ncbi:MAG: PQQ-dependent sugar dehydrogenase [Xanthomonadales bacterium]|nr:PQQ-dependent sugar dehydrogenase [Xanthomonadales bacterium]
MIRSTLATACLALLLAGCTDSAQDRESAAAPEASGLAAPADADPAPAVSPATSGLPFQVSPVASFRSPWAMSFLPDGRLLVTEKAGALRLFDPASGNTGNVTGVPAVDHGGQGGLGDVVLHPSFSDNGLVYLSYAEAGEDDTRGAAVARARLVLDDGDGRLEDLSVIWRQVPKTTGRGHFGHRLAFGPDGHLWITSGERQKFDPSQDMTGNLGKVLRLNDDGSVPADNPFADQGGVAAQVWSLGHRNPLGIDFDDAGRLWVHEMGPAHGDELNLIQRGGNYGYPLVSDGDHYDGTPIPDHNTRPEFIAPAISWVPAISPAGFVIYQGDLFGDWRGSGLIGGLSSQALVRVAFEGEQAREVERYEMGARIREVEQGPDGAIWVLEDERDGSGGRLLRLDPARP